MLETISRSNNPLLDDLDLIIVNVDDPALMLEGGGRGLSRGVSITVSVSAGGSIGWPASWVSVSISGSIGYSWSYSWDRVSRWNV